MTERQKSVWVASREPRFIFVAILITVLNLALVTLVLGVAVPVWIDTPVFLPMLALMLAFPLILLVYTLFFTMLIFRRPWISVDGIGIAMRPSWVRGRFTSWSKVAEIEIIQARIGTREGRFVLLTRTKGYETDKSNQCDPINSIDQGILRQVRKARNERVTNYDLVGDVTRIEDSSEEIARVISHRAPRHVAVTVSREGEQQPRL